MSSQAENRSYDVGAMAGRPSRREQPPLGKKLAELRKKRGLTQIELAEQLGVTQQTVTHYERRATNPSAELILRLAEFFDVNPVDLMVDEGTPSPRRRKPGKKSSLDEAIERARTLPSKQQKVVAELIDAFVRANT